MQVNRQLAINAVVRELGGASIPNEQTLREATLAAMLKANGGTNIELQSALAELHGSYFQGGGVQQGLQDISSVQTDAQRTIPSAFQPPDVFQAKLMAAVAKEFELGTGGAPYPVEYPREVPTLRLSDNDLTLPVYLFEPKDYREVAPKIASYLARCIVTGTAPPEKTRTLPWEERQFYEDTLQDFFSNVDLQDLAESVAARVTEKSQGNLTLNVVPHDEHPRSGYLGPSVSLRLDDHSSRKSQYLIFGPYTPAIEWIKSPPGVSYRIEGHK